MKNVRVKDKRTALDNEAVQKAIEQTAEELGSDGRILVRESGTEPVIRVMVEAASDEICENMLMVWLRSLNRKDYVNNRDDER